MNQSPGQPRFRVDGVDVPPSVQNVMSELGPEVVIPVGDVDPPSHQHGRQGRVDGVDVPPSVQNVMSELGPEVVIPVGDVDPPSHQHGRQGRVDGVDVSSSVQNVMSELGPEVVIPVGDVPPSHQHGQQVQGVVPVTHYHPAQVHGVAGGSGARQISRASAMASGVLPEQFHPVPLHLQGVAVRSGPMPSPAPGVLLGQPFHPVPLHLRSGHLEGVAVPSGPMRSPAPVVRRPPIAHQPDPMLRTVHLSPIPLGFHDTLQLKLQMEQIFGINSVEQCKLPIQHKGYGFVTFFTQEICDAAISKRTINLNLRQGTEADALSLKPALRR